MKLAIHTIEKTLYDGDIKGLTVPTGVGEITVLENHLPLVTITKPGLIRVLDKSDEEHIIEFGSLGFLEVRPENGGVILFAG